MEITCVATRQKISLKSCFTANHERCSFVTLFRRQFPIIFDVHFSICKNFLKLPLKIKYHDTVNDKRRVLIFLSFFIVNIRK